MKKVPLVLFVMTIFAMIGCTSTIHQAAKNGNVAAIQKFINSGIEVNSKDENGQTPLFLAASYGQTEAIKLLLSHGADVNVKRTGMTPIILASAAGNVDSVNALIEGGADVNALGGRALSFAALNNFNEVVTLLISNKIDVNATNENGVTVLWQMAFYDNAKIAKTLIDAGADINFTTSNGISVLGCAKLKNSQEMVQLLLQAGAEQ
jgi:uncharacterized protein